MKSELDTTGLRCPVPVLRTRRALAALVAGDVLVVRADDPSALTDIPAFCRMAGHSLVHAEDREGVFVFEIRRGPDGPTDDEDRQDISDLP